MLQKKDHNRALILLSGCLALAYLLPFHVNPFRAFFTDWLVILGIVIAIAYLAENKSSPVRIPWIVALPIAVTVAITVQAGTGMLSESWDALLPVLYLLLAAAAVMLGASITGREGGAKKLCMALATAHLVAGLISVVIASFQFAAAEIPFVPFMMLMIHKADVAIRPHANLGQANQLALLFCISIASVWWLFQAKRVQAGIAVAMVAFLLWGLVVTQSRIGWLIVPFFAFLVRFRFSRGEFMPVSGLLLGGLMVLYFASVLLLPHIASEFGSSTVTVANRVAGSGSARMALFEEAWKISLAHPWFGAGWFQFGPQQVMGADFPMSVYAHHAHNIVLNFAAELGWPLAILICGGFLMWLIRCFSDRALSAETAFAALFFGGVLVHSLVEYPLWYALVLMPFSLLVGMVHQEQLGSKQIELSRHYIVALTVVMATVLLGVGMDYRRVVAGFNEIEFEAMGVKWDATATEKPSFTIFPYMYDYFRFLDMTVHTRMSSEEIAFMERTTKRFGGVLTLNRMSQVYAMNGREEDAVRSALAVQRLHRTRYRQVYEDWRRAPAQYQNVFRRLPPPTDGELKTSKVPPV